MPPNREGRRPGAGRERCSQAGVAGAAGGIRRPARRAALRPDAGARARYSGAYVVNLTRGPRGVPLEAPRPRGSWPRTRSCSPPRPRSRATAPRARSAPRCWAAATSTRTASGAATSTCAAAATPPSGAARFTRRSYGGGATVEGLAKALETAGIERVTGRVFGDESRFDSLRGGPDSGYGTSIWVGPAERALLQPRPGQRAAARRSRRSPPAFAAAGWTRALEARGVPVRRAPRAGRAPSGLDVLASVESPPMARLVRLTNKPSDNFFAEMLVEGPGAAGTRPRHHRGRRAARRRLRPPAGARARLVDGSGLSRGDRASPYRWCGCSARSSQRGRLRRLRGLAADRRPRRHARRPDAQRARRAVAATARPARSRT